MLFISIRVTCWLIRKVYEFCADSVAFTNMFLSMPGERHSDLHVISEAQYRLYVELRRRMKEVNYSERATRVVFEGKKIKVPIVEYDALSN